MKTRMSLLVLFSLLTVSLRAQDSTDNVPSLSVLTENESEIERPMAALNSGLPGFFANNGMSFGITVKNDLWDVMRGGVAQSRREITNADLTMSGDLGAAAGLEGTTVFLHFMGNNGGGINDLVGDYQMVSNIEAYRTVKLYEAWVQHEFTAINTSILFGLFDLNSEFYVTPTSSFFINSSQGIGIDVGQSGTNGPSIFPNTAVALRLRVQPSESFSLSVALFDGHPGAPDDGDKFDLMLSRSEGIFSIAEAAYTAGEETKLGIGAWYYTGPYVDQCTTLGNADPVSRYDNAGLYGIADQLIWNSSETEGRSLHWFGRAGISNHHINDVRFHAGSGVVLTAPFDSRPDDRVGYAFALASFGNDFRAVRTAAGEAVTSFELAHEWTYRARAAEWLTLQGEVQVIIHPSASLTIPTALISGLRVEIAW